jgi:uncharacterized membrane protein (UPF0127 family)
MCKARSDRSGRALLFPGHAMKWEKIKVWVLLIGGLGLSVAALRFTASEPDLKALLVFFPSGHVMAAQVADTPDEHVVGLFFHKGLSDQEGFLLMYEESGPHRLSMRNAPFPVDMIWLDGDKTVLQVEGNLHPCKEEPCPLYGSPETISKYVLQVTAGLAKKQDLRPGMTLEFRPYPQPDRATSS